MKSNNEIKSFTPKTSIKRVMIFKISRNMLYITLSLKLVNFLQFTRNLFKKKHISKSKFKFF